MALKKKKDDGFEEVVDQIEEEGRAKLNDSVVSEDGCVYDEPLLAGYLDKETGTVHDTFSYREMTGADEEAIGKPDVANNGGRTMTTLVERCVFKIGDITKSEIGTVRWGKIIREMYIGDLEYMMFKIRELSKGGEIEFKHRCPNCRTVIETSVDTSEFTINPFKGSHDVPFELRRGVKDRNGNYHKTGTVRLITGSDAELVLPQFKKNQASATTFLMTKLLKFDDEGDGFKLNTQMVSNMTTHDRETILDIMKENTFGVEMDVDITCPNCGEYLSTNAGTSNFL